MLNRNQIDGISVFDWLDIYKKQHKNKGFKTKYDKKKINILEPGYELLHQKAPLYVVTHPYMLRKWLELYSMAGNKSFADLLVQSNTSADIKLKQKLLEKRLARETKQKEASDLSDS